ncbi:MAG: WYL domain-containing protein [Gammaproteobacteria bacterium]|nr:WYL domain-containing protein [Gammaproteobacteria bacterium]
MPRIAQWIAHEVWHPAQQTKRNADGSLTLIFPYAHETELLGDILKYGPEVEVIQPETLRRRVVEELRQTLGRYG